MAGLHTGATLRSWPDHIKVTVRSNQLRALTIYVVMFNVTAVTEYLCYNIHVLLRVP